jgi:hypothetical protein
MTATQVIGALLVAWAVVGFVLYRTEVRRWL